MNGINNWPNRTGAEDYENKTVQGAFDFRVGTTYAAPSHASAVHGDDTPLEKGLKYSTEQFRTAGENAHPSRLPERVRRTCCCGRGGEYPSRWWGWHPVPLWNMLSIDDVAHLQ